MRLIVRIVLIVAAFITSVFLTAAVVIYLNQNRIVGAVLASVKQQTGIDIVPTAAHLYLTDHLLVELDQPRVMSGNHEIVALKEIRALVNFRTIFTHGLPLRELDLEGPELTVPFDASSTGTGQIPRPDREMLNATIARLGDLARISRRLEILDLELRDKTGLLLLHNANLVAYHRRATPNLWSIAFKADCEFPRIRGAHAVGNFKIGEGGGLPATQMLAGNLRFSHLPLARLTIGNVEVNGQSHGNLELAVAYDASIEGLAALGVEALTVRSPDLSSPVELGNYSLEARFSTSSDQVSISEAQTEAPR